MVQTHQCRSPHVPCHQGPWIQRQIYRKGRILRMLSDRLFEIHYVRSHEYVGLADAESRAGFWNAGNIRVGGDGDETVGDLV